MNINHDNSTRLSEKHTKDLLVISNLLNKLALVLVRNQPIDDEERALTSMALFASVEMISKICSEGCTCAECENERDSLST